MGAFAKTALAEPGDLLLILSGEAEAVRKQLGELRLEMSRQLSLAKAGDFKPLWVVDFPLLEWDEDGGRFHAMHHPFTSPKPAERHLMSSTDRSTLKGLRADAYDLVINGAEIGGGSIRIHDRELQARNFDLLGFTKEEAEAQFGFLMGAFEYGAPPHGGIAFGFDRLCAVMQGKTSIRDYIAFPKNNQGRDTMIDAPDTVSAAQLGELGLEVVGGGPYRAVALCTRCHCGRGSPATRAVAEPRPQWQRVQRALYIHLMPNHLQDAGRRTSVLYMQDDWVPDHYYHIIGKAIPGEVLFKVEADYRRFLRLNVRDLYSLIFQIYVYCLIPNHYHLAVRTRTAEQIRHRLLSLKRRLEPYQAQFLNGEKDWRTFVIDTFRAATSSHAQFYNGEYERSGQLFVKPTLHGLTDKGSRPGELYSKTLVAYIAFNYFKHGMAPADADYMWSSARAPKYHIIEQDLDLHYGGEEPYKLFQVNYLKQYGARMLAFDEERFHADLRPREYIPDYDEWREIQARQGRG